MSIDKKVFALSACSLLVASVLTGCNDDSDWNKSGYIQRVEAKMTHSIQGNDQNEASKHRLFNDAIVTIRPKSDFANLSNEELLKRFSCKVTNLATGRELYSANYANNVNAGGANNKLVEMRVINGAEDGNNESNRLVQCFVTRIDQIDVDHANSIESNEELRSDFIGANDITINYRDGGGEETVKVGLFVAADMGIHDASPSGLGVTDSLNHTDGHHPGAPDADATRYQYTYLSADADDATVLDSENDFDSDVTHAYTALGYNTAPKRKTNGPESAGARGTQLGLGTVLGEGRGNGNVDLLTRISDYSQSEEENFYNEDKYFQNGSFWDETYGVIDAAPVGQYISGVSEGDYATDGDHHDQGRLPMSLTDFADEKPALLSIRYGNPSNRIRATDCDLGFYAHNEADAVGSHQGADNHCYHYWDNNGNDHTENETITKVNVDESDYGYIAYTAPQSNINFRGTTINLKDTATVFTAEDAATYCDSFNAGDVTNRNERSNWRLPAIGDKYETYPHDEDKTVFSGAKDSHGQYVTTTAVDDLGTYEALLANNPFDTSYTYSHPRIWVDNVKAGLAGYVGYKDDVRYGVPGLGNDGDYEFGNQTGTNGEPCGTNGAFIVARSHQTGTATQFEIIDNPIVDGRSECVVDSATMNLTNRTEINSGQYAALFGQLLDGSYAYDEDSAGTAGDNNVQNTLLFPAPAEQIVPGTNLTVAEYAARFLDNDNNVLTDNTQYTQAKLLVTQWGLDGVRNTEDDLSLEYMANYRFEVIDGGSTSGANILPIRVDADKQVVEQYVYVSGTHTDAADANTAAAAAHDDVHVSNYSTLYVEEMPAPTNQGYREHVYANTGWMTNWYNPEWVAYDNTTVDYFDRLADTDYSPVALEKTWMPTVADKFMTPALRGRLLTASHPSWEQEVSAVVYNDEFVVTRNFDKPAIPYYNTNDGTYAPAHEAWTKRHRGRTHVADLVTADTAHTQARPFTCVKVGYSVWDADHHNESLSVAAQPTK